MERRVYLCSVEGGRHLLFKAVGAFKVRGHSWTFARVRFRLARFMVGDGTSGAQLVMDHRGGDAHACEIESAELFEVGSELLIRDQLSVTLLEDAGLGWGSARKKSHGV